MTEPLIGALTGRIKAVPGMEGNIVGANSSLLFYAPLQETACTGDTRSGKKVTWRT